MADVNTGHVPDTELERLANPDPEAVPEEAAAMAVEVAGPDAAALNQPEARYVLIREDRFQVVDELPGFVTIEVGALASDDLTGPERLAIIRRLFDYCVVPADRGRLKALLRNAEPPIRDDELVEVMKDLVAAVLGRPTG